MWTSKVVAGIDVGGPKKGFHCVALKDDAYLAQFVSCVPSEIAAWCRRIGAQCVGIDAPCRWSQTGRARPAERELMAQKIWCFSTPSKEAAESHPRNHFGWMLNGAELYRDLETTHELFDGAVKRPIPPMCFETFPQAIACSLAGRIVTAKRKRSVREGLLNRFGLDTSSLTNIDLIDAALCALTANYFAHGHFKSYGETETGLIVVPTRDERA